MWRGNELMTARRHMIVKELTLSLNRNEKVVVIRNPRQVDRGQQRQCHAAAVQQGSAQRWRADGQDASGASRRQPPGQAGE